MKCTKMKFVSNNSNLTVFMLSGIKLTLVLLNPIFLAFANSVDPDQLASEETN